MREGGLVAALVVMALLACPLSPQAGAQTRRVLVLSSSPRPFSPQSTFTDAIVPDLIRASREPIDFVEMSVQDARSSGLAPDVSVAERVHAAFGSAALDLVITIGGTAASFAQEYRQQLFPATPILFAGVDSRFVQNGTFTDRETAVAAQHEPVQFVDEILRVLPGTRTIMVVIGASNLEQFWVKELQRQFAPFDGRLQFAYTTTLSFAEILERSRTLPDHSAILFALLSLDARGEPQVETKALASILAVANAPTFGLYDRDLGRGIVGGPLLSLNELSRTTAQVAVRILAGETPGSIQTPIQRPGPPTYDWRQLRRWHVPESRLASGAVVLFREPTIWQRANRPVVLGALIGVPVAGMLLLVGLVMRRRVRGRGPDTEEDVVSATAVRIWRADADGLRADVDQGHGVSSDAAWTAGMHPEDVGRCLERYRHAFARREPFQMEYRVRADDGAERWILDTGLPRFSGKEFDGYVGSAVDVTGLGRARAELSNLSRHLMEEHERESAAVARKLQEDVCQRIMALTLRLHALKAAPHDAERQSGVEEISKELAGLVGELVTVPDPVYQKLALLGLTTASEKFCERLSAEHDVAVHFRHDSVPADLPTDVGLVLFRVLQEASINAVTHSASRDIWVSLCGTGGEVRLEVLDLGVGFDTERDAGDGVGLVAIRERLKLVNGGSTVHSRPGGGTLVEAWVPASAQRRPGRAASESRVEARPVA